MADKQGRSQAGHYGVLALRASPPRTVRYLLGAGGLGLVVLAWWLVTLGPAESRVVSPVVLPSPREVFASFASLLNERALLESIAATLRRVLLGFGVRMGALV